ncbi:uncharacterized protein LOC126677615 isoform X2 [Mercurialis annua]|uniref:uncharacterized protein LOC126677615 isoform X2 n=1 Tax=Mercurialis annua TaxID=3986 RepID=UPI00215E4079|nr:uncharacterized protein LOC126677615 isoform X2 [Mercurialis annua]
MSEGGVHACNDAEEEEEVDENGLSSAKRRKRVDFDSGPQCSTGISKPCGDLNGILHPKVVYEQECLIRSPSNAESAATDLKHAALASKEKDIIESIPKTAQEWTQEDRVVACSKDSHQQIKDNGQHNGCADCMLDGELLCCSGKGCQRRFHLSCLDPPLDHAPFGVWHCIWCVKKKIKLGVHSVSQGMESVWDVREVASDQEVKQTIKEYLVKYQGLAHVHNHWISETDLLLEAPKLIAKFKGRNQLIKWKTEWTVPQRLLQKRWLSLAKNPHGEFCSNSDGYYEWLVKWTGLGYDHATWELENASFLTSSRAGELIKDYESRHDTGEKLPNISQANEEGKPNVSKLNTYQPRKANICRLSELSSGDAPEACNNYLNYVNKLCEHWHKGENGIIFDDQIDQLDCIQERIVKIILFIVSLQHIVWRPFLIISSANTLSVWEDEFLRVAPSVNFIVYKGSRDVRSGIRSLEFSNKGGKVMFQVLISSSNICVEDLEVLKSIAWRAVIIDDCQRCFISRHFKEFKMIATDRRLLLSNQVKDCSAHYVKLLSLLESRVDELSEDNLQLHSSADIAKMKERLAPYIVYECKSNSFVFVEYWVPVWLSNVQLEQYCSVLLSNAMLLCSFLKNDHSDALREIVTSIQKCCDHPYLLDQSLQSIIRKGVPAKEYLDVEIQVSGKLLLLDKMLMEINSQGLRALIIFQSIGSGPNSVGDILEDFVQQRFGKDCYVRIDGGVYARTKKQAALNLFNNKESGRFVFLIENRACLSSIILHSVDAVILFDSDLDPSNDLRALQRITIKSQFYKLKVFRLYSCFTIEEMVMILAREGVVPETLDSKNRMISHSLLSWDVSRLFNKLDEFHQCTTLASDSKIYSEWSFLEIVVHDFSDQLHCIDDNDPINCSLISKAPQSMGKYLREIPRIGEKKRMDSEPPFDFWKNLLDGKRPQWLFLFESSPRIRRKVNYVDNSTKDSEILTLDANHTLITSHEDRVCRKGRLKRRRKLLVADGETLHPVVRDIARVFQVKMAEPEHLNSMPAVQKNAQFLPLMQEITQLCDALKLPDNVKSTCMALLKYMNENYNFSWKGTQTFQALQISLCWIAASLSKFKIDFKESLVLSKLYLKFECKEEEADYIYSELQSVKKKFSCNSRKIKIAKESNPPKNSISTSSNQGGRKEEEFTMGYQSHSFSAELVGVQEGEIPIANSANYSRPARLDEALEEGEIAGESPTLNIVHNSVHLEEGEIPSGLHHINDHEAAKFDQQDLEEGEIPSGLHHTNDYKAAKYDQQDLEEGEIPYILDSDNQADQIVPNTLEGDYVSQRLDDSLKNKKDDSDCQKEIHTPEINLETPQLISTVNGEQLKAAHEIEEPDEVVLKPILSAGSQCLSDTEAKIDKLPPTDMSTMPVCAQSGLPVIEPSLSNRCETLPRGPPQTPDSSLKETELHDSQVGIVTIIIDSDAESEEVKAIVIRSEASTLSEKQSPDNVHIVNSVITPPKDPQSRLSETVTVGEPMLCSTQAMSIQNQSLGMQRANASQIRHETASVTPTCIESSLEFTGTSSSVVGPDFTAVNRYSVPTLQPPVFVLPSHTSDREVQFSTQPLMEFDNLSINDFPLPSSRSTHIMENDSHAHLPFNGAYAPDFRSTADNLGRMRPSLNANHVMPESPQLARNNPLLVEMEKIRKDVQQDTEMHEQTILHLKSECDREVEEVFKKYDMLFQNAERELIQKKKDHRTNFQSVFASKLLADMMLKQIKDSEAEASDERTASLTAQPSNLMNELIQPSFSIPMQTSPMMPVQYPLMPQRTRFMELVNQSSPVLSGEQFQNGYQLQAPAPHLSSSISQSQFQYGYHLRAPAPHINGSVSQFLMSPVHLPVLNSGVRDQHLPS